MVDMKLTNKKLQNRGKNMIMEKFHVTKKKAEYLLQKHGNVRNVINKLAKNE